MTNNKRIQFFRDGVSQRNRLPRALKEEYVSVNERSWSDLLKFVQKYATGLSFYDESDALKIEQGLDIFDDLKNWESFVAGDIQQMIAYINKPESFADDELALRRLSQPHLVIFFTFLQLLRYPQEQFQELTQRHLEFYYKEILKLTEKEEVPDRVHVIFSLAKGEKEYCLQQDTLLNAGQDSEGFDLKYETDEEIILNQAQVASVKTLSVSQTHTNLKTIHQEGERDDESFEDALKWAVGSPERGDPLPNFRNTVVDITYLKTLYQDIKNQSIEQIETDKYNYILNKLFFASIDDFKYCLELHIQEVDRGDPNRQPTKANWERVYKLLERAYHKKITFRRRDLLKQTNLTSGFQSMIQLALGEPNPRDSLPEIPYGYDSLDDLFNNLNESTPNPAVARYVEEQLYLTPEDFRKILKIKRQFFNDKNVADWDEVYRLVEKAQTKKRNFTYPPIDQKDTNNIYAKPIANVEEGAESEIPRFMTFQTVAQIPGAALGFAIASPLLLLKEGTRQITITFICQANTLNRELLNEVLDNGEEPFDVYYSSEEEWTKIPSPVLEIDDSFDTIRLRLQVEDILPAIKPPKVDESSVVINTSYPVIKVILKNIEQDVEPEEDAIANIFYGSQEEEIPEKIIHYDRFKSIQLEKVIIEVDVRNVQALQLRNDSSVLNYKSPFQPFGYSPKGGSGFYLANPEICCKTLESLAINIEWMGLPEDFATHYQAYTTSGIVQQAIANDTFTAKLKLLNNRNWYEIEAPKPIFTTGDSTLSNPIQINYNDFFIPDYNLNLSALEVEADDPFEHNRYFKLELENPDFEHDFYPLVLTKVALARDDEAMRSLTVYPPYTPEIKTISLDYTASEEINLRAEPTEHPGSEVFQIHPFGYVRICCPEIADLTDQRSYLLPQYDEVGTLFIGIRNLQPLQNLSLFFQLMPGSANVELVKPDISWSYLSRDRWLDFSDTQLLSDTTNGLVDSGIICFSIPEAATPNNQMFNDDLYWLRAVVKENAAAIPDTLDIKAQAVSATFVNQGNADDHLSKPLSADSITALAVRNSAIKTVAQPYTSFQGKMKEDRHSFNTRVSERLRHKQRALTPWDYERLVLERFPEIYKVKCITSALGLNNPSDAKVTVVVVPDIANTAPFYPLEPKAPLYTLKDIEVYLKAHTSPFVNLVVKNPRYERIKYRVSIRFRPGYDQGYYRNKLNEDIIRFLSPWAYEGQVDITFGSSIHSSLVIHFIEKRPYVDYVANLRLFEQVDTENEPEDKSKIKFQYSETNIAQVRHPDSILVSATSHMIDVITTDTYQDANFEGIGYMIIDFDFIVT
ncbi:MAG: hypothetical protein AAGD25_08455 [Cyanobacteria bacterium P01_F01_bin.150]